MHDRSRICAHEYAIVKPQQPPLSRESRGQAQNAVDERKEARDPEPGPMIDVGGGLEAVLHRGQSHRSRRGGSRADEAWAGWTGEGAGRTRELRRTTKPSISNGVSDKKSSCTCARLAGKAVERCVAWTISTEFACKQDAGVAFPTAAPDCSRGVASHSQRRERFSIPQCQCRWEPPSLAGPDETLSTVLAAISI